MRRLFASKPGFAFLVIAATLAGLLLTTVWLAMNLAWPNIVLFCEYGSIGVVVGNLSPPPLSLGFNTRFLKAGEWFWMPALWPELRPDFANMDASFVSAPIWMPLLPSALASWFFYYQARRRRRIGHCTKCSYDLTGNVSGVCPECGTRTAPGQSPKPN